MKETKKKIKEDKDFDKCIEEFADLIVEEAKEHHRSELEPFELYAAKIRSKVHANVDEFRTRFAKGYHVLLEELGKEIKEV